MDEILRYTNTRKLAFGAALRPPALNTRKSPLASNSDSDSDDESGFHLRRPGRRKRPPQKESLASRLMHNKAVALDPVNDDEEPKSSDDDEEDSSLISPEGIKKPVKPPVSPSPPPSPPLSLPPPHCTITPQDNASRKVFEKADAMMYQLKWGSRPPYSTPVSDYSFNDSSVIVTPDSEFTLRLRCRGRVYKYPVSRVAPLFQVCSQLAAELGTKTELVLLSYQMATVQQSETPAALGLTTADIIDAIIMDESVAQSSAEAEVSTASLDVSTTGDSGSSITIKVQSSKKSITYKLAKTDPLQKAMTAFAAALDVPLSKLRFTFDGDLVDPNQTAQDLDMENDDVIDAAAI